MSPTAETLLQESLKLPDLDRAEIASQLLNSLNQEPGESDLEGWDDEIANRIRELKDGTVQAIPWTKARALVLGTNDESQL